MRFISDRRIAELPSLAQLEPAERQRKLALAQRVYQYLIRQEDSAELGLTELVVRSYGERNDIGPDDMTAALDILRETGQVTALPESGDAEPTRP